MIVPGEYKSRLTFNEVKSLTWAQLIGLLNALTSLNAKNKAATDTVNSTNDAGIKTSHLKMRALQKEVQARLLKEKQEDKNGIK